MPRRGLLIAGGVALALTIASTWVVVLYEDYLSSPIDPASRERVLVRVRPGSFDEVVESLVARGLVKDPTFFKVYATLTGKRDHVKAGAFLLARSWTPRELLDHLIDADPADRVRLTTPEGQSVWQVADRIDALGLATRAEVLDAAADWGLAQELGLPARAPSGLALTDRGHVYAFEGYLFPKTYELPAESDARALVKRMGRQFLTEWAAVKAAHRVGYERVRREHGLDDHALVTLASLVEEETANGAERALIAGVFYNRLRKQWRLQTDPTLVYHPERYGKVPTVVDRKNDRNPWNTYVVRGLPPGPISSPGAAALAAVLEPARTDMLFFVAKRDGTGTHHFSRTAKEHEDAVRRYLK
ncbi:MAG: hypothetical protein AMXMBFR64_16690 [Myxococcales bacterium]